MLNTLRTCNKYSFYYYLQQHIPTWSSTRILTYPSRDFSASCQREQPCMPSWAFRGFSVQANSPGVWPLFDFRACAYSIRRAVPKLTASQIPKIQDQNLPDWDLGICILKNSSVNSSRPDHWIRVWGTTVDDTTLSSPTSSVRWAQ